MDTTRKMEAREPKVESIRIVLGKHLPEEVRVQHSISPNEFVEIRMERVNPVTSKVSGLGKETPGRKFGRLLKDAQITF